MLLSKMAAKMAAKTKVFMEGWTEGGMDRRKDGHREGWTQGGMNRGRDG
jgi:hypothetical protein